MKIYTKTGDLGETGLFRGPRVRKDHDRVEAYGGVDELNAVIGHARAQELPTDIDRILLRVQSELFDLGAELASPAGDRAASGIQEAQIEQLEADIDRAEAQLTPLTQFILPAGSRGATVVHMARAVCRRAERGVVHLANLPGESVSPLALAYLNRLSDLLFVLARWVTHHEGAGETVWISSKQRDHLP